MPAGISYAADVFHARSAFHKSTKWIYFIEKSIDKVDAFFMVDPKRIELSTLRMRTVRSPS